MPVMLLLIRLSFLFLLLVAPVVANVNCNDESSSISQCHDEHNDSLEKTRPTPEYGWVRFRFDVSIEGKAFNLQIVDAEPKGVFEQEALNAMRKWRFKPKKVDGKAVVQTNQYWTVEFNAKQLGK